MSQAIFSDEQIIAQLAKASPIEYERQREGAAKELGIRVSILDALIKNQQSSSNEDRGGNTLVFQKIELWETEVNGAELLLSLSQLIQDHVILTKQEADTIALWALFTYCIDVANTAPILNLCSPEKGCGKSTLITLLESLVYRPLLASNITPAAIFRTIEAYQPTLLLDEVDTFICNDKSELRGIINSGHTRPSAFVIRNVGDNHIPQRFTTWSAKCLAGIGKLPDTIKDRSITITLRRKLKTEVTKKIRYADKQKISDLKRQCARFAIDNSERLSSAQPILPDELSNRAADNWEILFAIADLAGGNWRLFAKQAALSLSTTEEAISLSVELLVDIKRIFMERNVDRLPSAELIWFLCENDESPWATYSGGKPITPRQLASCLKEFKITSGTIRLSCGKTPKGFYVEKFIDAFERYLPSESATPPQGS